MGASDKELTSNYMLFVTLPSRETFTCRRLPPALNVSTLKANLELLAGVPSRAWDLCYGEVQLDDGDAIVFGENVRDCSVMRMVWRHEWGKLCDAVIRKSVQCIEEELVQPRLRKSEEGEEGGEEAKHKVNDADVEEGSEDSYLKEGTREDFVLGSREGKQTETWKDDDDKEEDGEKREAEEHETSPHCRRFVALFLAVHRGYLGVMKQLLNKQGSYDSH